MTAIGGTSTFLNRQNGIKLQTGWGNNETLVADPKPNPPVIPPSIFGFVFGAGGGSSFYFPKPSYQNQLSGPHRHVPDISMNADSFTGNEIIITPDSVPGNPHEVDVLGGTSLSCPMFSGVWAIANQAALNAGIGTPLGQAAPLLYQLGGGNYRCQCYGSEYSKQCHWNDIRSAKSAAESDSRLPGPAAAARQTLPQRTLPQPVFDSLVCALVWYRYRPLNEPRDNVTGLGTPNGSSFINSVVAAAQ